MSGGPSGGRTWWAHLEFTRINITPTILRKMIGGPSKDAQVFARRRIVVPRTHRSSLKRTRCSWMSSPAARARRCVRNDVSIRAEHAARPMHMSSGSDKPSKEGFGVHLSRDASCVDRRLSLRDDGRRPVQRLFSMFPNGWPGTRLLLLRKASRRNRPARKSSRPQLGEAGLFPRLAGRRRQRSLSRRWCVTVAIAAASSTGSTGFGTCAWNPAARIRARSCARA